MRAWSQRKLKILQLDCFLPKKVTPDDEVVIEFSFNLLDESVNPHIAFSFVDISTGNGLYNDNSMDVPLSGVGPKKSLYKCKLPYFNHVKLRLVAFLRDENQEKLSNIVNNEPSSLFNRSGSRSNKSFGVGFFDWFVDPSRQVGIISLV